MGKKQTQLQKVLLAAEEAIFLDIPVIPLHAVHHGRCSCGCDDPTCSTRGKHPRTQYGCIKASINLDQVYGDVGATTDEDQVKAWFDRGIDVNLGIATGDVSDFVAVEINLELGSVAWNCLEALYRPFPATRTYSAGSEEIQLYQLPEEISIVSSAVMLWPGITLHGNGGYVVARPSSHLSGDYYSFSPNRPRYLEPLPAPLLARLDQIEQASGVRLTASLDDAPVRRARY